MLINSILTKLPSTSNKDKSEILEQLFALQRHGIKPGLERILSLMNSSGNQQNQYPSVHVAGTNGKGAVCCIIASILAEAGYMAGLYTSPHITDFNERIRVNGIPISDDEIVRLAEYYIPFSEEIEGTFFEITTAMAFKHFADSSVDIAILETGMGGRFDSTNIVTPLVSIITSISIDHTEYLGSTLESIASEKAGIIKPGVDVVLAEDSEIAAGVVCSRAGLANSEVLNPDDYVRIENIKYKSGLTTEFDIILSNEKSDEKLSSVAFPLPGAHQLRNLKTALTALHSINNKFKFTIENIRSGLANIKKNTGYSGRIELVRDDPPLVVEVGHNPSAVGSAIETLRLHGYGNVKWQVVFGVMADKDAGAILELLRPVCNQLIATTANTQRAADAGRIAELAGQAGIVDVIEIAGVEDAMRFAFDESRPVLIIGSFYMAEKAYGFIGKPV